MRSYKTEKINGFWIAWYENDPTGCVASDTEDSATDKLFTKDYPPEYHFEHNRFLASDEGPWMCRYSLYSGVIGSGCNPAEAYEECQKAFRTTWHERRLSNLFKRMLRLAKAESVRCFGEDGTEEHYQEVNRFIEDWGRNRIGVKKR